MDELNSAEIDFAELLRMIVLHRRSLDAPTSAAFDDEWGFHTITFEDEASYNALLASEGKNSSSTLSRLRSKLIYSRKGFIELGKKLEGVREFAKGFELMHLLQMEMLVEPSKRILHNQRGRVYRDLPSSTSPWIIFAVSTFLLTTLLVMSYFIVAFGSFRWGTRFTVADADGAMNPAPHIYVLLDTES